MKKIIVIPDIHGRTFWKDIVYNNENEDIIFLGDYHDPYGYEGIWLKESISNFKEIIEFKKSHMNNVTLLLGNHDFGYINEQMPKCRYDYTNTPDIQKLFKDNLDLFDLIVFRNVNGKRVSFSHSVINTKWIKETEDCLCDLDNETWVPKSIDNIALLLNSAVHTDNQDFLTDTLYYIGRARGGWNMYGSMIWADVSEGYYLLKNPIPTVDYQIFGHSQQEHDPILEPMFACLDVRQGFIINEQGHIINENLNVDYEI